MTEADRESPHAPRSIEFMIYRTALETRNMEISLFWQRSGYFLALNTAIAAGFFAAADSREAYRLLFGLLGAYVSALWVLVNLGSKFWQSRWEQRLHVAEENFHPRLDLFSASWDVLRADVEASLDDRFRRRGPIRALYEHGVLTKPSVSFMMTLVSASFVVFWVAAVAIYLYAYRHDAPKVTDVLTISDLFTVGLGFDIAGAYLVARGVLASPAQLMRGHGFVASYRNLVPSLVSDRIDGISGIWCLFVGFALQATAYVANTAGASADTGAWRGVIAGLVCVVAFFLALSVARLRRRRSAVLKTLVLVARHDDEGRRHSFPRAEQLHGWAIGLGYGQREDEDDMAFLTRVFGIGEAVAARDGGGFDRLSSRRSI